ncbi:MAG: hypothetical protein LBT79_01875 [Elusimicrobiota bacterium]|nr:hypothetical protein [Elusimicrobiota bacterium]
MAYGIYGINQYSEEGNMQTLLEKLVAAQELNETCLTRKWLLAGFPISGDYYRIDLHTKKRAPKEDKGFKIFLSAIDQYSDLYIKFAYDKYKIGAQLPLWTGATSIMIIWLEAIVLGRSFGVSFDEEGGDLYLYAEKINDKFTNFLFFACINWNAKTTEQASKITLLNKVYKKRVFHIKIETKKLVNMFYSTILEYAKSIDVSEGYEWLEESKIPLNVCNSEIINKFLDDNPNGENNV